MGAVFESEPCFPHGTCGVFISGGAKIGKDVVIFQHVTIGYESLENSDNQGAPVIGNSCYIGSSAKIIDFVRVGGRFRVGANSVVYSDMESESVAV